MVETARTAHAVYTQFDRDGVVVVPDLITRDEAHTLKAEIRGLLDEVIQEAQERGEDVPTSLRNGIYVGLSKRSAACRQIHRDPRLLDVIEAVIGPNVLFWSDKVVFKAEDADFGTPWHQDWPYWKGIHKVTLWLALDDIDEANGCLQFVRGSHRDTFEHHAGSGASAIFDQQLDGSDIDPTRVMTVPCPAGTAVVFHDLTLHDSLPNTSHRDRYALAITYKDAAADDLEYPAMTAAEVVRGQGRVLDSK